MEQHVDIDDGHLGIIQQVPVFGHNLFFQDLINLCQQPYVKTGIPIGAQQGHHQGFDGRVARPISIR